MIQIIDCGEPTEMSNNIIQTLRCRLIRSNTSSFSLQEQHIEILDPVSADWPVYIIPSISTCANSSIVKLMITANELKARGVENMHAILPYMPYSRQNRPLYNSHATVQDLILHLLTICDIKSIITVDLHNTKVNPLYHKQCISIDTTSLFAEFIAINTDLKTKNIIVVAPDNGSQMRAASLSAVLHCPHAMMQKQRQNNQITISFDLDMHNKSCIIIDDIIDGGRTLELAVKKLLALNAAEIFACCTHIMPYSPILGKLNNLQIRAIIVTNSMEIDIQHPKLKIIDISRLIANNILSNQYQSKI